MKRTQLFLNLGGDFVDKEVINWIRSINKKGDEAHIWNNARENLERINMELPDVLAIETNGCESKNRLRALGNMLSLLNFKVAPSQVVFFPTAPKALIAIVEEEFITAQILKVDYKQMKFEVLRNHTGQPPTNPLHGPALRIVR